MINYRVLVVDDEPFILNAIVRLFHREKFDVITASSAAEALDIIRSQPVQVIITDNIMPGMSGVELIHKIKEISPKTIRMVLSGHSDLDSVLNAVNRGEAFRFILKPWNDIDLKSTVYIALAHYRLQESNDHLFAELSAKSALLEHITELYPGIVEECKSSLNARQLASVGDDA